MIKTDYFVETVHRARCSACGSTGPMAMTPDAARVLAVLCGWDEQASRCLCCKNLTQEPRDGSAEKPKRKARSKTEAQQQS